MTSDDVETITKDIAGPAGREAVAGAGDVLDAAPSDIGAGGLGAIRTGGERVARRVTQQPIEALLLASAIGYLVGWAVKRA